MSICNCSNWKLPLQQSHCTAHGLAHTTGVHKRNTVPYALFTLKKRHAFCAKARKKKHAKAQTRHTLDTVKICFKDC